MDDVPAIRLELRIPRPMLATMRRECERLDITLGQFAREAIEAQLRALGPAKTRAGADERLLAGLRPLLARALETAESWSELQAALAGHRLELRPRGGGLALFEQGAERPICKASEIGPGYAQLIRRFGAPFPGHTHSWLAEKVLGAAEADPLIEP